MPNFVWSAKDRFGKQSIREVAASTVAESMEMLLAEGYTELVLQQDEVGSAANEAFAEKTKVFGEEVVVTAEERMKHRNKPPITFTRAIRESVFKDKGFSLILLGGAIIAAFAGYKILAVLLGVGYLAWITFVVYLGVPSIYYARLHKADEWHRWTEVLDLVEKLKRIRQVHIIKVPLVELGRFRAKALSGLGRLPDALEEYKRCENQPGCPTWLYHAFVASIYEVAKQYDNALVHARKSVELNPRPTVYVDLAHRLLHYKKDVVGAKEALAKIDVSQMVDLGKPFYLRCLGILAYLEGDYNAARKHLEEALGILESKKHLPYRDANLSLMRGYLSCVLAKQGDLNAARNCFAQAQEYLVTTKRSELLEECKAVVGVRV